MNTQVNDKKWVPRNVRKDKKEFIAQLNLITPKLPRHYGIVTHIALKEKGIDVSITQIRTVKAGKAVNWEILKEFKRISEIK